MSNSSHEKRLEGTKPAGTDPSKNLGEGDLRELAVLRTAHPFNVVRVTVNAYEGNDYVSIRNWFLAHGRWQPTQKGVNLSRACAVQLSAALAAYLAEE